jgi:hypothetical protein
MWILLITTLPTQPNAVRLRIWRALKALGCVALRDGAYLLPESEIERFETLADEVGQHGGTASVLNLMPRNELQQVKLLAQFDRTEAFVQWRNDAVLLGASLEDLAETEARRKLRGIEEDLRSLRRIDYYPGAAAVQAESAMTALRSTLEKTYSKGEPRIRLQDDIERLDPAQFQTKRWATRSRPWVDRLSSAWLIRRFIDRQAAFVWLPDTKDDLQKPDDAIGFDYDGAQFTHIGDRVTFETLIASFALEGDLPLQRIAATVHYLDIGGIPSAEATGLEAILGGLRAMHADDDMLLAAASAVFDALYATPGSYP